MKRVFCSQFTSSRRSRWTSLTRNHIQRARAGWGDHGCQPYDSFPCWPEVVAHPPRKGQAGDAHADTRADRGSPMLFPASSSPLVHCSERTYECNALLIGSRDESTLVCRAEPSPLQRRPQPGIALSRKVDLDVASEPEIEALRGIGPSLARRIVADRDSFGPFGSTAGLRRVRGVGAALVARLDSSVTFSLVPRPMNTVIPGLTEAPRARVRRRSKRTERDTLP